MNGDRSALHFSIFQEVHVEEDHAVGDIFNELKDEFVLSFKRATFLMKFHMSVSFTMRASA